MTLQIGKRYTVRHEYGAISATEITVTGHLGAGQIVDVFEVTTDRNESYAARVARLPDNDARVRNEYAMLANIHNAYPDAKAPIPGANALFVLDDLVRGDQPAPVMLMPVLRYPQLFDVYRQRAERAEDSRARLEVERLAWEAAEQYLELLDVLDRKIGRQSADRKRDTFLWDADQQRLVVVDWNVTGQQPVQDALRNFAQNWYTLLTRKRPETISGRFDDATWGAVSLVWRDLLNDILRGRTDLARTLRIVQWILVLLDDEDQLLEQFATLREKWQQNAGTITPVQLEKDYRSTLYIADLVNRRQKNNPTTAAFFTEVRDAFQTRGAAPERRLSPARNLEKLDLRKPDEVIPEYAEAVREVLQLLDESGQREGTHVGVLYNLLDQIAGVTLGTQSDDKHDDVSTMEQLLQQWKQVEEQLLSYRVTDAATQKLHTLKTQIDLYEAAVRGRSLLMQGDAAAALVHFQFIRDQISSAETNAAYMQRLGMDDEQIAGIIANIDAALNDTPGTSSARRLARLRVDFIQTANTAFDGTARDPLEPLETLARKLVTLQLDLELSFFGHAIIADYRQHIDTLEDASIPFTGGEINFDLMQRLTGLYRSFPEIREAIRRTPYLTSLVKVYRQQQHDAAQSQDPMATLRAQQQLAHVLIPFATTGQNHD